jgi:hypothetical protein
MDGSVKPTYQVRIWQEDDWWLARVVAASEGADHGPLNALTQARSLARIESMSRDLIATILDTDESDSDVELEFMLPGDIGELIGQAKGARAWLDAAQDLWHERSSAAARALTAAGYSLREAAILLGLSHQRVDQLLGSHPDHDPGNVLVFEYSAKRSRQWPSPTETEDSGDLDALLVVRRNQAAHSDRADPPLGAMEARFRDRVRELVMAISRDASASAR